MPAKPRHTSRKLLASLVLPPVAVIALVVVLVSGSKPASTTTPEDASTSRPDAPPLVLLAKTDEPPAPDPFIVDSEVSAANDAAPDDEMSAEAVGHVEEVLDAEAPAPEVAAAAVEVAPAPAPQPPAGPPPAPPRQVQPTPRPAPTATPIPPPLPAAASPGNYEADFLAAHNAERARAGLPALQGDATLTAAARRRAQDMAARGYFAHTSPSGESISTILNINSYSVLGENIARNTYPANQTVGVAMSGFMQSASHRANVLSREFTRVGIGTSVAGNQRYFSVVYGAPR